MLDSFLDIGLFVLILIFLVVVHEMGHMVVAKWCGMKVERFSVFMGRPLVSFTRGETEYGVGWLPLGGYVKITGMTREEDVAPEDEARTYYNASTPRKIATIFAGPGVNFIVAFLAFVAIAWIGIPNAQLTNEVALLVKPVDQTTQTPAEQAGLMAGDVLISANGVQAKPGDLDAFREQITANPGTPIELVYARDQERFTRSVAPALDDESQEGRLGFIFQVERLPGRTQEDVFGGIDYGWDRLTLLTEGYVDLFRRLATEEEARRQVNSVVGAGAIFDVIADDGWLTILLFLGGISFALAFFNLLPVLPLDGGHIVIALVERVIGRPLPARAYSAIAFVGLAVIMLAFLYILQNDISLIRGGNIAEELQNR